MFMKGRGDAVVFCEALKMVRTDAMHGVQPYDAGVLLSRRGRLGSISNAMRRYVSW